jgi:hypothetical protein
MKKPLDILASSRPSHPRVSWSCLVRSAPRVYCPRTNNATQCLQRSILRSGMLARLQHNACLKEVSQLLIAFAVLAVPIAILLKEGEPRMKLKTEFGLKVESDSRDIEEHTETGEKAVDRMKPLLKHDAPEDEITITRSEVANS